MDLTNTSFNAVLTALQILEDSSGYNVFLPSQKTESQFKILTTEQLKNLLKTVIDTPIYNTQFTLTFNKIIKDNCLTSEIFDKLTIQDKLFIFLKTRAESISDQYTFSFNEEEIKQHKLLTDTKIDISIAEIYSKLVNLNQDFTETSYAHEQCTVTCTIPTLETENKLEKEFHKNTKINVDTPEELREIVGNTFINEITKYISSIQINEQILEFNNLPFKSRVKVVEKLPANLIKNVLSYIETYKLYVANALKVKLSITNKDQKQVVIEKELPFDASFFNT